MTPFLSMLPIPLLSTLRYPSLSAIEPSREFAILAPAADEVLNVPPNGTTNLSLRYVVRGFTGRLCLTLTRGQLQFYRGPVLHRDASLLKHYAKGCFDAGQPITLQGLRQGMYALAADLRDGGDAVSMTHSPIFFAVAEQSADAFEPTYEWQEVQEGQSVPSGLDVRLSLDGTHKTLARILPTWRLQVYTRGLGFVRHEVTRHSRLLEIEAAAVAAARRRGASAACSASLWSGAEMLSPTLSVDEAQASQPHTHTHTRACSHPSPHTSCHSSPPPPARRPPPAARRRRTAHAARNPRSQLFARRASLKFQLEGCELDPESVATAVYDHEAHRGLHVEPQPEPRASSALMVVDT